MDAVKSNDRTSPETEISELQDIADDIEQSDGIALMLTGTSKQLGIRRTAMVVAALRRPGVAQTPDLWRPIDENTPKDRAIMLCVEGYQPCSGRWWPVDSCWAWFDWEGHFESDAGMTSYCNGTSFEPTHWMPLPQGPDTSTDRHVNKMAARGPDCACCEQQPRKDCTVPGCTMKDVEWAIPAIHSGSLQCLRCGTVDAFGPVSPEKK